MLRKEPFHLATGFTHTEMYGIRVKSYGKAAGLEIMTDQCRHRLSLCVRHYLISYCLVLFDNIEDLVFEFRQLYPAFLGRGLHVV